MNQTPNIYILNEHEQSDANESKKKSKCSVKDCNRLGNTNPRYKTHSSLKSCSNKVSYFDDYSIW